MNANKNGIKNASMNDWEEEWMFGYKCQSFVITNAFHDEVTQWKIVMEIFKDVSIYGSSNIANDKCTKCWKSKIFSSNETLNAVKVSVNPETAFEFY